METEVNKLEVCTANVDSALAAQKGGAHRIELCDNLPEGGTTPSAGMIKRIKNVINIDIYVMIRPRGGDFYYSELEFKVMMDDIRFCREHGVDGVVIGCLNRNGTVNKPKTKQLIEYAWPMRVTFHRAFDLTPDPLAAMEDIIECGADRILTSGQKNTAPEGSSLIRDLVKGADKRIIIMPGSGINETNILDLKAKTGATEFHMTGKTLINSQMEYRKELVQMGSSEDISAYKLMVSSEEKIRKVVSLLKS
ncbi:MAG: copper homeostasis protein CutC [Bacteroidales bacterium]|nr:copper homeostasis protein CutC [Bacteroidales bacterium]